MLPGCFSGSEKVEQINPASCSAHTTLFRASWSLGAAHPSAAILISASAASSLFGLHELHGKDCHPRLGCLLSVEPRVQMSPLSKDPPCWLCVSAACLGVNEVSLVLMVHFGGWECSLTNIAVGAFKPPTRLHKHP